MTVYIDADRNILPTSEGAAHTLLVSIKNGCLLAMLRAVDRETFHTQARLVGLLETRDENGKKIHRTHPNVDLAESDPSAKDVRIAQMPVVERSPGVIDPRYHVNFRLNAYATGLGQWMDWAIPWSEHGVTIPPNNAEVVKSLYGIELIDPDTIANPRNWFS